MQTLPFSEATRPTPHAGQIAAMAIVRGPTLVTSNPRAFAGLAGLRLVNWFEA